MADESFERRRAHAFLDDIKVRPRRNSVATSLTRGCGQGRFVSTYGRVSPNVRPMAMQSDFSRVLQKQADFFSFDPSSDKITQVREEVNKTKQVMVDSIDKVLQRGEKIELLVQLRCCLHSLFRPVAECGVRAQADRSAARGRSSL